MIRTSGLALQILSVYMHRVIKHYTVSILYIPLFMQGLAPLDMFVCEICQYPSREPHLSGCCGRTFCKSCLEAAKRATNISQACPICHSEEFITLHNKQVDRAIRSLHLFFTNKDKGFEWQNEVNDIINHLGNSDSCQFEEVTCSNDCGKCLQRQYLAGHVEDECLRRKVDCQYCHIAGEHQFIEDGHKRVISGKRSGCYMWYTSSCL